MIKTLEHNPKKEQRNAFSIEAGKPLSKPLTPYSISCLCPLKQDKLNQMQSIVRPPEVTLSLSLFQAYNQHFFHSKVGV